MPKATLSLHEEVFFFRTNCLVKSKQFDIVNNQKSVWLLKLNFIADTSEHLNIVIKVCMTVTTDPQQSRKHKQEI